MLYHTVSSTPHATVRPSMSYPFFPMPMGFMDIDIDDESILVIELDILCSPRLLAPGTAVLVLGLGMPCC